VKKSALCFVLLLTLPASATISWVQTKATWNCTLGGSGGTLTCQVPTTTHVTSQNLLAIWTFWQSSSTYTAAVSDSPGNNFFYSAVGPTIQSNRRLPSRPSFSTPRRSMRPLAGIR
jgi:hypothetical protein